MPAWVSTLVEVAVKLLVTAIQSGHVTEDDALVSLRKALVAGSDAQMREELK